VGIRGWEGKAERKILAAGEAEEGENPEASESGMVLVEEGRCPLPRRGRKKITLV
jgi:hypothetical protein